MSKTKKTPPPCVPIDLDSALEHLLYLSDTARMRLDHSIGEESIYFPARDVSGTLNEVQAFEEAVLPAHCHYPWKTTDKDEKGNVFMRPEDFRFLVGSALRLAVERVIGLGFPPHDLTGKYPAEYWGKEVFSNTSVHRGAGAFGISAEMRAMLGELSALVERVEEAHRYRRGQAEAEGNKPPTNDEDDQEDDTGLWLRDTYILKAVCAVLGRNHSEAVQDTKKRVRKLSGYYGLPHKKTGKGKANLFEVKAYLRWLAKHDRDFTDSDRQLTIERLQKAHKSA
jgi:hypothetical protein